MLRGQHFRTNPREGFHDVVERAASVGDSFRAIRRQQERKPLARSQATPPPKRAIVNFVDTTSQQSPQRSAQTQAVDQVHLLTQVSPSSAQFFTPAESFDSEMGPDPEQPEFEDAVLAAYAGAAYKRRQSNGSSNEPTDICFEWYAVGHRRPNCPHQRRSLHNPHYARPVLEKYQGLSDQQKDLLRNARQAPRFITMSSGPMTGRVQTSLLTSPVRKCVRCQRHQLRSLQLLLRKTSPGVTPNGQETEPPPPSPKESESSPPWTIQPDQYRARTILSRSYGLLKYFKLSSYRVNPLCFLSLYNYKVSASVGVSADRCVPRLSVLDTGAGPNLIREDLLPQDVVNRAMREREIVNL